MVTRWGFLDKLETTFYPIIDSATCKASRVATLILAVIFGTSGYNTVLSRWQKRDKFRKRLHKNVLQILPYILISILEILKKTPC